jgi:DNA/RNA endonuclease G (NUC1)
MLIPGTEKFLEPKTPGRIILQAKEVVEFFCSSGFVNFPQVTNINGSCTSSTQFLVNGTQHAIRKFECKSEVNHTAVATGGKCFNNSTLIKVGFPVGQRFLTVYQVCHEEKLMHTYWTRYTLSPMSSEYQTGVARPEFDKDKFFVGVNVNDRYTLSTQNRTLSRILGSQQLAASLLSNELDLYMARGHLAAKSDFIFGPQQLSTFYFINCAPQWQTFNGKNWERVEDASKNFAATRSLNLDVITGTHGIHTLADVNDKHQLIHLDFQANIPARIPAPKIYYKLLIDWAKDAGIALIGTNNPHATLEEIKKDYIFCNDVSHLINWIQWDKNNITRGYSYACDVNELNKVTGHFPDMVVKNLLY